MSNYDDQFFKNQTQTSTQSARQVVDLLLKYIEPRSVIDVGCGTGAWLASWQERGVRDILGIDGDYVNRNLLVIPKECFVAHDLKQPYCTSRKFDLAMSLEVAEHLPPEGSERFIQTLTELSSIVLFSAAIPDQGGVDHINEQWQSYWAGLFRARGYVVVDFLRSQIWSDSTVSVWYAQNMLLYVSKEVIRDNPQFKEEVEHRGGMPLDVVHPAVSIGLAHNGNPARMSVRRAATLVSLTLRKALRRRFHRSQAH